MMRHLAFAGALLLTGVLPGGAAGAAPDPLAEAVRSALRRPGLDGATVAVCVQDVATGEVLVAVRAGEALIPASNQKVLTCAAAWLALGSDHAWETPLLRQGAVDAQGRLTGDLLVRASGDPTISARFGGGRAAATLEAWAKAVRAAGIRAVSGRVLLDDRAFDDQTQHPSWPAGQASHWYAAQIAALTLNDACVDLILTPAAGSPTVACDPPTGYVTLERQATATASRREHEFGFWRNPGTNTIRLTGKVWTGAGPTTQSIPVHDPALFFGAVLDECLRREGITLGGPARRATPEEAARPGEALALHRTPLALATQVCLARSQNLYAEHILKTLGRARRGKGTFADGAAAVTEVLRAAGVPVAGVEPADGSGFSRDNRVTAAALAGALVQMARRPDAERFRACLAAPGEPGTLDDRMTAEPYRSAIRGKTGYLQGISALCGYADARDGGRLAFAVIVNGLKGGAQPAKDAQDAIAKACVDLGPAG